MGESTTEKANARMNDEKLAIQITFERQKATDKCCHVQDKASETARRVVDYMGLEKECLFPW